MRLNETPLVGVWEIALEPQVDERGFFARTWDAAALRDRGLTATVLEASLSYNRQRGTLRGLHFQRAPHEEAKFVSCLAGEVFDVAVDLRKNSPSYLRWHGEILSAGNARSLLIPEGFAHGFQTLSDNVEMLYFHSASYAAGAEDGLRPDDPALAIVWPLPISEISPRDRGHRLLSERDRP